LRTDGVTPPSGNQERILRTIMAISRDASSLSFQPPLSMQARGSNRLKDDQYGYYLRFFPHYRTAHRLRRRKRSHYRDQPRCCRPQELNYSARISLDRTQMQVEDRMVSLAPGMAVTVEIKTGSRTILDYLLSPLRRYRQEILRERQARPRKQRKGGRRPGRPPFRIFQ
jgi:multidrug efflux pump subunit AcrA (membrane-fusion protein)